MKSWITPEEATEAIANGTGKGVRIAVLDSGVESSHPGLNGLQLRDDIAIIQENGRIKAIPGNGVDLYGHGTALAGIIRQTAPDAEIGSIRVLGEALASRTAIIMEGAKRAIDLGYHILNCSLGCGIPDHVLKYKTWVDDAYLRGVHVVAACNNEDVGRPEWPGFFTSVLTVNMATDASDSDVFYRPGHLVEFAAKGVDVQVLWRDNTSKKMSGSSFAAPRVTGMLARMLSIYPTITPLQAKALFHRLARPWNSQTANER
jgi:subtilisin